MEEWIRREIEEMLREFKRVREEINRIEEEVFRPLAPEERVQVPLYEVRRSSDCLTIYADLAGVKRKEDVDIYVEGNVLRIEARLSKPLLFEGLVFFREGITKYKLEIPLPSNADVENIKASFRKGILEVTVPLKVQRVRVKVE